ncbi:MAG: hypothetical protein ABIS38_03665 [Sphingomicrobium sp.]
MTESKAMHSRFMLITAVAVSLAAPIGAEPGKVVAQQASQPVNRPAQILLAQADIPTGSPQADGQAPQADSQTPAPAKKRTARVSACRCGGQTPQQP